MAFERSRNKKLSSLDLLAGSSAIKAHQIIQLYDVTVHTQV